MEVPELLQAESDALYRRATERLDDIVNNLEVDMVDRPESLDSLAWLLSQKWMRENVTNSYLIELATTALYRLARRNLNGERP